MSEPKDFVGKMVLIVKCNAKYHVHKNGICICYLIEEQTPVKVIRRVGCCGLYNIEGAVRAVSFDEFELLPEQSVEPFAKSLCADESRQ